MAKITVIRADFSATIQDMGRRRVQHLGLAQSGVADEHSCFRANHLVGNSVTTPVIEIVTGLFSVTTDAPVTMALAGADMSATLNKVAVSPWQSFVLMPGKVPRESAAFKSLSRQFGGQTILYKPVRREELLESVARAL